MANSVNRFPVERFFDFGIIARSTTRFQAAKEIRRHRYDMSSYEKLMAILEDEKIFFRYRVEVARAIAKV